MPFLMKCKNPKCKKRFTTDNERRETCSDKCRNGAWRIAKRAGSSTAQDKRNIVLQEVITASVLLYLGSTPEGRERLGAALEQLKKATSDPLLFAYWLNATAATDKAPNARPLKIGQRVQIIAGEHKAKRGKVIGPAIGFDARVRLDSNNEICINREDAADDDGAAEWPFTNPPEAITEVCEAVAKLNSNSTLPSTADVATHLARPMLNTLSALEMALDKGMLHLHDDRPSNRPATQRWSLLKAAQVPKYVLIAKGTERAHTRLASADKRSVRPVCNPKDCTGWKEATPDLKECKRCIHWRTSSTSPGMLAT